MTKRKIRTVLLLTIGLLWIGTVEAQESVNTSGGDATGSGGTVAFSVGQVVYTAESGSSGSIAQGVQHTYKISDVGVTETTKTKTISLVAFPNPTVDDLTLKVNDYTDEKLTYQLFNATGKEVNRGQVKAEQTQIEMAHLSPATYFLNVVNQKHQKIQSFKIIKTQ